MAAFDVVETFVSINGEGTHAGQLAVFVRFAGCNLRCSFCDTMWANEPDVPCTRMTTAEICEAIDQTGIHNVTLTGGEPLLREGMAALLRQLAQDHNRYIEIETNGSVPLAPFTGISPSIAFTMDYKLPGSGMEAQMCTDNFALLTKQDTVKFVAGSYTDLERALEIIRQYDLTNRCHVYFSPVFGKIEPVDIVTFMQEHVLNDVTMQLQMHKIIWDPEKRGV
ncbi:MAG: putative 7-carboxy-7-deazaguanine synthase QueE [Eubacteriales bacterium]|nr:putative 7-carboxy-7-deazaguanine synthase QueE [Eubacteriales bacterium]